MSRVFESYFNARGLTLLALALGACATLYQTLLGVPQSGFDGLSQELFDADPGSECALMDCYEPAVYKLGPWNLCLKHSPFNLSGKE